jgi:hypothetical protein
LSLNIKKPPPKEELVPAVPVDEGAAGATLCPICCDYFLEADFFSLSCKHSYCKNCMADHLRIKIVDGQVHKISCMDFTCNKEFKSEDIKKFGSSEIYRKYLKFKENIEVETDRNLKWCPKIGCMNFVRRQKSCCCFNSNTATCECGESMCFKCGAKSHPGVTCDNVGNAELREYMATHDVIKCPNCGFGTEKIDGCNHMTCGKCSYNWCWICRGRYYSGHFGEFNIFGCPGGQFSDHSNWINFLLKFLMLIAIPFILLLGPIVGLMIAYTECWNYRLRCKTWVFFGVYIFFQLPLAIAFGGVGGVLACGLLCVPALLY